MRKYFCKKEKRKQKYENLNKRFLSEYCRIQGCFLSMQMSIMRNCCSYASFMRLSFKYLTHKHTKAAIPL